MQVIITREEQTSIHSFNLRFYQAIVALPNHGLDLKALRTKLNAPLDLDELNAKFDMRQFNVQRDAATGSLIINISTEVIQSSLDYTIDQYKLIIDIGIALYPMVRLAKRLVVGLKTGIDKLYSQIAYKRSPFMGWTVLVDFADASSEPMTGRIIGAHRTKEHHFLVKTAESIFAVHFEKGVATMMEDFFYTPIYSISDIDSLNVWDIDESIK